MVICLMVSTGTWLSVDFPSVYNVTYFYPDFSINIL